MQKFRKFWRVVFEIGGRSAISGKEVFLWFSPSRPRQDPTRRPQKTWEGHKPGPPRGVRPAQVENCDIRTIGARPRANGLTSVDWKIRLLESCYIVMDYHRKPIVTNSFNRTKGNFFVARRNCLTGEDAQVIFSPPIFYLKGDNHQKTHILID